MKKKLLHLVLVLLFATFFSSYTKAQADSLVVSGVVMSADSMHYLPNTHYTINTTIGGLTNANAKFTLLLQHNDTLRFSHIGYQPVEVIVPDSLTQSSYVFGIFMRRDTIELPEVIILPRVVIDKSMAEKIILRKQKEQQVLTQNIRLAKYQAAQVSKEAWDAEMNQKHQMQKFKNDYLYAGQVSPAETFNFLALIPFSYYLISGKLFPDPPPAFKMNENEEVKVKLMFQEQIRMQRTLEKSIR